MNGDMLQQARTLRGRWRFRPEPDFATHRILALAAAHGVNPLVARLLAQRGVEAPDAAGRFLEPRLSHLHDPASLPGCEDAAERLVDAARRQRPVVIYGDYDVDGVCASAILWHMLRLADAKPCCYVPHRVDEGYGLNAEAIEQLAERFDDPLIVTVDCGITATGPARRARELGVELIITDHHAFDPAALPEVPTLVHPSKPGESCPFEELCGAGVAFKLGWAFARRFCGSQRLPETWRVRLLDSLSLAALATVADVVPLVDENRVIVRFGLGQVKRTGIDGLNALIDAARLREETIDAFHVGFVLGPRLNACGRMGHAREAVKLLTEARDAEAQQLAAELCRVNEARRRTEKQMLKEAEAIVAATFEAHGMGAPASASAQEAASAAGDVAAAAKAAGASVAAKGAGLSLERAAGGELDAIAPAAPPHALVVGRDGWHPGVLGIVASRLVDRFHRPSVMLQFDPEAGEASGSARSVEGVCLHELLSRCDDLLTSWGGHAMAAGLRLPLDHVEPLRRRLDQLVAERLSPDAMRPVVEIDLACELDELAPAVFDQIDRLAPFGRRNPAPVLASCGIEPARPAERIGRGGEHLRVMFPQHRRLLPAIGWGLGSWADRIKPGVRLDIAFQPRKSTWRGRVKHDLILKDLRPAG